MILPKVISIMEIMTKKQRKLVTDNLALMKYFVGRKRMTNKIPRYLEDDFISDAALRFCISAIKYDEEMGYKFSTYAYGGFKICWDKFKTTTKDRYERENFCSTKTVELMIDKLLNDSPRKRYFDRDALCFVIDKANLTWQEMRVIQDYYFGDYSMSGVGKIFAVTRERIRQIIQKALSKLKRSMDANKLTFEDFYVKEE